jgi:hypothetical protein
MLQKISTLNAVFITFMAAGGLALKPIIGPLGKIIGSIFFIPGGAIAGAVYMIWPMLALLVVQRFGVATLVGLIEGIIVIITGIYGSHGILSLITYLLPCILIDIAYVILKKAPGTLSHFIPPALGNTCGTLIVAYFMMHLPDLPLLLSLIPAFIFGGFGGILAAKFHKVLIRTFPQFNN